MRLDDLATPTHSHFRIIYGPQNLGCILGNVENGKGNLMGKYITNLLMYVGTTIIYWII